MVGSQVKIFVLITICFWEFFFFAYFVGTSMVLSGRLSVCLLFI